MLCCDKTGFLKLLMWILALYMLNFFLLLISSNYFVQSAAICFYDGKI